jgi:hypothetical protein
MSFSAPLPAALLRLEPLTTPQDRYVLIETHSSWTAIFSNGLRVNDVGSPVAHLPTILKCRGLEISCVPDRSDRHAKDGLQIYGAVVFTLYGSEKTDWLNRIRHVGVTKDVGSGSLRRRARFSRMSRLQTIESERLPTVSLPKC